MAGFVKGKKYDWKFELPECEAKRAYELFELFKLVHPDAKLYCNGKLVGK